MYLHHPQTQLAKKMLEDGKLGALQTVSSWFHFFLPPEDSDNIRLNAELVGGCLWDVGVYPNSMAVYLFGKGAPKRIWAEQIIGETGVDVAMRAQMSFADEGVAQVSCGFRTPMRQGTHVVGDKGILTIPEPWKPGVEGKKSVMVSGTHDGSVEEIVTPAVNCTSARFRRWRLVSLMEPINHFARLKPRIPTQCVGPVESADSGEIIDVA